ncbi:MAG TPA: hypothetical protein VGF13_21985, partial [Verrucomicrobiae bacterium]
MALAQTPELQVPGRFFTAPFRCKTIEHFARKRGRTRLNDCLPEAFFPLLSWSIRGRLPWESTDMKLNR